MNAEDRFDAQVRAALEWHADAVAEQASSVDRAVRQVAARVGPDARDRGGRVVLRPAPDRGLRLVLVALLLALLLAVAMSVGADLFRPPLQGPRFGFDAECLQAPDDQVVYTVAGGDVPMILYADGRLVEVLNDPGDTRAAMFDGMGGNERRLSPAGIDLLRERVASVVPAAGCRHLRSVEAIGELHAETAVGHVELSWHPSNPGRRLTAEEESEAEALEEALAAPETWLPASAWLALEEQFVAPEEWLVIVEVTPTGLPPGSEVALTTGDVLSGSDPRYARVQMPGGVAPAAFGEVVTTRDTTTVRCGVVDEAAARELAGSLDALPLAMHDEEELYTEDLSARVFIYIATGYPQAADCEAIATVAPEPTPTPPSTPRPEDDLAGVEPCSLVPRAVDDMLGGITERASEPAFVDFGAPARTCFIRELSEFGHAATRLAVTLYPRSTDLDDAAGLASAVLGGGHVADTVNGTPVWINDCLAEALECSGAAVVSSGPHALVIEAPADPVGGGAGIGLDQVRRIIEAIVAASPAPLDGEQP